MEKCLIDAIQAAQARRNGAAQPSYKERLNASTISLVLNKQAIQALKIDAPNTLRQFTLRADTRKDADALRAALEKSGVVYAGQLA